MFPALCQRASPVLCCRRKRPERARLRKEGAAHSGHSCRARSDGRQRLYQAAQRGFAAFLRAIGTGFQRFGFDNGRRLVMALTIKETCINCDVCEPVCPNQAIRFGETIYWIRPEQCTECVGHYETPQCVAVCPVDCIVPDPAWVETEPQLLQKLNSLQQDGSVQPSQPVKGRSTA